MSLIQRWEGQRLSIVKSEYDNGSASEMKIWPGEKTVILI